MTDSESAKGESNRISEVYRNRIVGNRYSPFNRAHLLMLQESEREMLSLLGIVLAEIGIQDLAPMKVLDVGCGSGYWLRRMIDWGAVPGNACGLDILPERVESARSRLPAACDIRRADAQNIPWPDGQFGVVSQFVMFSSVLSQEVRASIAREMSRVTAANGCILWYDFHVNNPRNPDVRAVRIDEVARLFPGFRIRTRRVNLAPPIARALLPKSGPAYHLANLVPFLRTHDVAVLTRTG